MNYHNWMARNSSSAVSDGKADTRFNVGQMKFFMKGKEYWVHPIYNYYGANKEGEVINIHRGVSRKGNYISTGYIIVSVSRSGDKKQKTVRANRFIWECHNGLIPEGLVIDHINDKRDDNRLCNLQLLTPQQNSIKAAKNRDYSNTSVFKAKRVKAINLETHEFCFYKSQYAAGKDLGIQTSSIMMICKGAHGYKSAKSKKDGCKYLFRYA